MRGCSQRRSGLGRAGRKYRSPRSAARGRYASPPAPWAILCRRQRVLGLAPRDWLAQIMLARGGEESSDQISVVGLSSRSQWGTKAQARDSSINIEPVVCRNTRQAAAPQLSPPSRSVCDAFSRRHSVMPPPFPLARDLEGRRKMLPPIRMKECAPICRSYNLYATILEHT